MKNLTLFPVACLLTILALIPQGFHVKPVVASSNSIAVIVHEDNPTRNMTAREVRKLFLGKSRKLPDGTRAILVSLQSLQTTFNRATLGKNNAQVKSAWARLQFTGRALPPREFIHASDVVEFVANNKDAIGYIPIDAITQGVKEVYVLE
ncbi:MAG: hypothetical protein AB8B64_05470 [Granulosicoccus sp.]